jgi:hypothetical protein
LIIFFNINKSNIDGWNSIWHFVFGVLAIYIPFIIPVFVLYQVIDWYDENMMIDLLEFFIGYVIFYFIRIVYDANGETKVETKVETKEIVETKETVETKEIVEMKEIEVKETKETVEIETKEIETKIENDLIA